MHELNSAEAWRWQMYRQVAEFINAPSDITEARLKALLMAYRQVKQVQTQSPSRP